MTHEVKFHVYIIKFLSLCYRNICPFSQLSEYKRRKFFEKNFSYSLWFHRFFHSDLSFIHLIFHGHPQFKKNKHLALILIHIFCDKKNIPHFLVMIQKPQNGIFIDLGNIIHFIFSIKFKPGRLLLVSVINVIFL